MSHSTRAWRGAVVVAVLGILSLAALPAAADLVSPGAGLALDQTRVHPDPALGLTGTDQFHIFTDPAMPAEWSLIDQHSGTPGMGTLNVVLHSKVYRNTDGHLLFAYQIENLSSSTAYVRHGNITGYEAAVATVIDSGLLHLGGSAGYEVCDPLALGLKLVSPTDVALAFAFEADLPGGSKLARHIHPGEASAWFYVETTATAYVLSNRSTVQDSGQSADMMEVLVPVPEPATLALLLGGALALLARRRGRGPR